jgi:phospholipid/cholesterol/gamma-HCH transport system substrate-binding protein
VDELVADVQARQLPQKVDDALGVVKDAAANIDESSEQLHQTIAEAIGPDKDGVPAAENISQSLSNLNIATANMADDTEALKHNLLFRGFFHRRGYYNLANLSPDRYREDHLFVDPGNYRLWLSAAALFKTDKSGLEVLSLEGKAMLNAAVLQNDGSAVDDPIVIEGYSSASDSAEQFMLSRQRAILVRQYLQNRFQLDGAGLGVVFLKNSPPQGLGHADWNGVCVVVVKQAIKGREQ